MRFRAQLNKFGMLEIIANSIASGKLKFNLRIHLQANPKHKSQNQLVLSSANHIIQDSPI